MSTSSDFDRAGNALKSGQRNARWSPGIIRFLNEAAKLPLEVGRRLLYFIHWWKLTFGLGTLIGLFGVLLLLLYYFGSEASKTGLEKDPSVRCLILFLSVSTLYTILSFAWLVVARWKGYEQWE